MIIESTETIDPVETAKEQVETALENLEAAVADEKIANVEVTAEVATDIALEASARANDLEHVVHDITNELISHEDSDQWLREQVVALSATVTTLQDELSILKASLVVPLVEAQVEAQEALDEVLTETMTQPETLTETSDITRTEALPESEAVALEAETPALEVVERKRRILV